MVRILGARAFEGIPSHATSRLEDNDVKFDRVVLVRHQRRP